MSHITFSITPVRPFRLDLTVWALRRRPDNVVDQWDGHAYQRALMVNGKPVLVTATQSGAADEACLQVTATGPRLTTTQEPAITAILDRLLGLQSDLAEFYRVASQDAALRPLAQAFRGVKPPRFPTPFEALINAIACQQFTLTVGIRLLNRLVEAFGPVVAVGTQPGHIFPNADDLARLEPDQLQKLGFSHQKARAMLELAQAISRKRLDLNELNALDDVTAVTRLRQLRGVGRWTAEYVLLRGLGRLNIFPGDDVGARNNLQRWRHLRGHSTMRGRLALSPVGSRMRD